MSDGLLDGCMGVPPRMVKGPCVAGVDIRRVRSTNRILNRVWDLDRRS